MRARKIIRVQDILTESLIADLEFLASYPDPWVTIQTSDEGFRITLKASLPPFLNTIIANNLNADNFHTHLVNYYGWSQWLKYGPKVVRPTNEQAESFANVDVRLAMTDYCQPFPAVYVETPTIDEFVGVMAYHHAEINMLMLTVLSRTGEWDVVTAVREHEHATIEDFLCKLAPSIEANFHRPILLAQRICLNMLLALSNFGCKNEPLSAGTWRQDNSLARENSERGERARKRVRQALHRVDFQQHTVVRRSPAMGNSPEESSGRTVGPHWVRGHWKSQRHGVGLAERKIIFVHPYLVHADQAGVISAIYQDRR